MQFYLQDTFKHTKINQLPERSQNQLPEHSQNQLPERSRGLLFLKNQKQALFIGQF